MQRWHVPWDHIENHWTDSQFYYLLAVVMEDAKEQARTRDPRRRGTSMREFTNRHLRAKGHK